MSQIGINHTFKLADGREISLETGKFCACYIHKKHSTVGRMPFVKLY